LIVVLAYIALKYFNVIEGNQGHSVRKWRRTTHGGNNGGVGGALGGNVKSMIYTDITN